MEEEIYALHRLLDRDRRYPLEAYIFVREGLAYASNVLNLGNETTVEEPEPELQLELDATQEELMPLKERHLTGQELCDAIRVYAINEFGYMARLVLEKWGITQTQDFGNIVYNMILMTVKSRGWDESALVFPVAGTRAHCCVSLH